MAVHDFIDRLGKATDSKQVVNCTVNFLSTVASSNNSNSITGRHSMLIKVRKPRKLKEDNKPRS
jgi:hypothetical protein